MGEMKDSTFDFIWIIEQPNYLALSEIRLCGCFLDGLCPLFKELFEARGRDAVEPIIIPKIYELCANCLKSKLFFSDDLLIVCCKEAVFPPGFMNLILIGEIVESCQIDIWKSYEIANCVFYLNEKNIGKDFNLMCLSCKINFLTSISASFSKIKNVFARPSYGDNPMGFMFW